eukprot:scaffold6024_cov84-Skeletonema_marinoi.AAC.2
MMFGTGCLAIVHCSACAVALKLSSLVGETAEDAGGRGRRNANPFTSIVELPSERSTSARIYSNEVVEVNEENNDGEGDDECAPAPLPVVLVLVGGGGHAIKGASCFVRLDCAAGGDLKVCLPRDGAAATPLIPTTYPR